MLSGKMPDLAGNMPALPFDMRKLTVEKFESLARIDSKLHGMIFNRAARDLDVIEWDGVICELLIIFVPFARDQHNGAWTGERNGAINCLGAIDNFFVMIRVK